jgi:hypothetical protein
MEKVMTVLDTTAQHEEIKRLLDLYLKELGK